MQFAFGKFDFHKSQEPPKETKNVCDVTKRQVNGRNVFTLTPKKYKSKKHILYFHGGAYVQNFVKQHWKFIALLAEHSHCTITAPDYPLAPKHTYVDTFDMVTLLYKELVLKEGASNIILMGDSAGGGLALALAQKMRSENIGQPQQIILLSPWLDITLKNPEIRNIDPIDPFLGMPGLQRAGQAYAGDTDPENFMLSPINGPLEGLGEISVFIGSRDIMAADARQLNLLAQSKGVKINYYEYEDMVHVWMLLNLPESKKAKQEIIRLINK